MNELLRAGECTSERANERMDKSSALLLIQPSTNPVIDNEKISFIRIHSFMHPAFILVFILSFILHLLLHSFFHSSCIYCFIHSFIHQACIHSFVIPSFFLKGSTATQFLLFDDIEEDGELVFFFLGENTFRI